jgi:hypothetical protein
MGLISHYWTKKELTSSNDFRSITVRLAFQPFATVDADPQGEAGTNGATYPLLSKEKAYVFVETARDSYVYKNGKENIDKEIAGIIIHESSHLLRNSHGHNSESGLGRDGGNLNDDEDKISKSDIPDIRANFY